MRRNARYKVALSLSKIPAAESSTVGLLINNEVRELSWDKLAVPYSNLINCTFRSSNISTNQILNLANSPIDYILQIEYLNRKVLFIAKYQFEDVKTYSVQTVVSKDINEGFGVRVSEDYSLNCVVVAEISLDIDLPDESLVDLQESLSPSPESYAETCQINEFILIVGCPQISKNLFESLQNCNNKGKNYEKSGERQIDLFGETKKSTNFKGNATRKAYEKKPGNGSSYIVKLSDPWDFIFTLLLPPLNYDFNDQFDCYLPLYNYQQKGIEFLINNTSALLADEMGTGKTVQSVFALRLLFRKGLIKNVLIVCPLSIVGSASLSLRTGKPEGWDGHIFYWAPELIVTVVNGNAEQRKMDWGCRAHVYIVTYDTLRNDIEGSVLDLNQVKFDCIIADEAQYIKNKSSGKSRAIKKIPAKYKWALSGTPIENKIDDIISIFDFIKPGHFRNEIYTQQEVRQRIEPHFLRRRKEDVIKDLPPKTHQEEWLELDQEQSQAYNRVLLQGRTKIESSLNKESEFAIRSHIFVLITSLKQICNFAPAKEKSPKTERMLELLENIEANNKKVIIFTQYSDYGIKKIENVLKENNIKYVSFTGKNTQQERNRAIADFRDQSRGITVFLGSVKAAGVGITLTEASYVIHFDHWWNPAVMWQAEDRAHRPGQKKNVTVYSFWMENTIEERIKQKLIEKGLLFERIINSLSTDAINEMISIDEWLGILDIPHQKTTEGVADGKSLQTILEDIKSMHPRDFEILTKRFFQNLGYPNARVTQISRDGGIDVFGSRMVDDYEETIVAQCKRTDTVSVNVARELLGVMASNNKIDKGFLVTSGDFTTECTRFAESNGINLINGITFAKYLKDLKINF